MLLAEKVKHILDFDNIKKLKQITGSPHQILGAFSTEK